jgi:hypothetical protein
MYRVELSKRPLRDLWRIDHKSRTRLLDVPGLYGRSASAFMIWA